MSDVREISQKALLGLLRPIARFALMRSLKFREVAEYLKFVFVSLAREELIRLEESVTTSKLSAMTGIQRRDVDRILQSTPEAQQEADVVTRVIGLWQGAKRFQTNSGKPKILTLKGGEGTFATLVRSVSTDLNPYTVAFELERMGIVNSTEDGLQLAKPGYEPTGDLKAGLQLLANDSDDLYRGVLENLFSTPEVPNIHIKTEYDNIPRSRERQVREWFQRKGAAFHADARKYLAKLDRDVQECDDDSPAVRVAVGTFGFTEDK